MYLPGLNISREPPIRSVYQSTPPPWHSHNSFFSGEPCSKNRNFFSFQPIPFEQTAFLRRTITCRKLYISTKANCTVDWKNKTAPPPPPPKKKYSSALPLTPPHLTHLSSGTTLSCCVLVCKNVCVCVCVQISSLKPLGQLKPNFMWNLHGIGKESLFKWSRKLVVLHYCQPPGGGAFSRDLIINLSPQCRTFSRALKTEKLKAPLFHDPVGAGTTNDWCIKTNLMCFAR